MSQVFTVLNDAFLSCLCGSDLSDESWKHNYGFLSCLCGSDQEMARESMEYSFLSCLCGSDQLSAGTDRHTRLSKLPMRQ